LAAGVAQAQTTNTGKVYMKGKIIASTCEVLVNGQPGSKDATVNMGTYGAGDFTKTGDVVGGTGMDGQVKFELTNCPEGKDTAKLRMQATLVSGDSKTIKLDSGTNSAGNVGIQIFKKDEMGRPMDLEVSHSYPINKSTNKATIELVGKYVSLADTVTPGDANGNFNYTISYN
jgi:major type 1 subunit fimbrin (pilin)